MVVAGADGGGCPDHLLGPREGALLQATPALLLTPPSSNRSAKYFLSRDWATRFSNFSVCIDPSHHDQSSFHILYNEVLMIHLSLFYIQLVIKRQENRCTCSGNVDYL